MRIRVLAILVFAASASLTLSLIRGQERSAPLPTIINGGSGPPRELPLTGNAGTSPPPGDAAARPARVRRHPGPRSVAPDALAAADRC